LVFWVAVLALLIVAAVWLARRFGRRPQTSTAGEAPLEAAQRRLATGEITVGEYDEIAHRLGAEPALADR
jgi:uncharacterized membrane protein